MHGTLEKMESREWVTIDNGGIEIFGVLHRPTQKDNPPIVVVLHGFASSKHGSNRCYVVLAEELAKAGIATLRFDFRGAGDSEGSLSQATFDDLISDAVAVTKFVPRLADLNADRLGLFGASLGGSIAVQASALTQTTRALALWAPVASGELWFRDFLMKYPELMNADPSDALATYQGVKLNPKFREQFAELFAYKTLSMMPALPLLHMHGEKDETISIAHQEAFRKNAGSHARFITYPEEAHSLGYAKAYPEAIQETVKFFKEHLV